MIGANANANVALTYAFHPRWRLVADVVPVGANVGTSFGDGRDLDFTANVRLNPTQILPNITLGIEHVLNRG